MTKKEEFKNNNEIKKLEDSVLKRNWLQNFFSDKKVRARIGTAFVYEIVGGQEVFDGSYPLLRGGLKEVGGDYTVIDYNGKIKYLSTPDPKDYTPTYNKLKKILHVTKMADDDFRVKKRLDGEWYTEYTQPLVEEQPVMEGEKIIGYQPVHVKDEKGELLYETIKEKYLHPAAIIQEGREAIKEGNEYEKKMEELRKKKESWIKQNIFAILSYGVLILMVISFLSLGGKIVDEFSEIRQDIYEDNEATRNYLSNGLIDGIANKVVQKQVEDQNPPE